jgi:hypothetical protein
VAETNEREARAFPARLSLFCWLEPTIQHPYHNKFTSIWEYKSAFQAGEIDWDGVLQDGCPLCDGKDCWRQIRPYRRRVIDLLPFREEWILVARFFCRTKRKTFSLLPTQLAPYCRYTVRSIVFTLLVAWQAGAEGLGLFSVAEKRLDPESRITGCTLAFWLVLTAGCLRRGHVELRRIRKLGNIRPGRDQAGMLAEVAAYCRGLWIRGPPGTGGLDEVLRQYSINTGRFLIGIPSQDRHGTPAS